MIGGDRGQLGIVQLAVEPAFETVADLEISAHFYIVLLQLLQSFSLGPAHLHHIHILLIKPVQVLPGGFDQAHHPLTV